MSGNPEQEYFSDGITEDIITDLSRISGLFVIARNSTFTFKDKSATAAEVSHVASWRRLRCLIRAVRLPTRGWPSLTPSST
jgi:TolB-like protein